VGARSNVVSGALGKRAWEVNIAAVHVLLNNCEHVGVDLGGKLEDRREVRNANAARFSHYAFGNRLNEWKVVFESFRQNLRMNLF
jgi:hypothetical protein